MATNSVRRSSVERKIISISGKRQVTIPQKYYEALGFSNEAECILQNNAIVIRPINENTGSEFAEQILADLIAQGLTGQELLAKFKEMNKNIASAMDKLISEADSIAKGEKKGLKMADIFEAEDR
ncbi:AbrB/MazE/SpoVT family DNA-binding domain-containing protein [Desulfoscipio sp. XC116]|uniref:AbrB/MazE/SpoVT family DNA-binding domain-containing protein n=1 Tax=Desulfoscipio sp. XC116 TaxID=3144975 RepID=UPI00325B7B10